MQAPGGQADGEKQHVLGITRNLRDASTEQRRTSIRHEESKQHSKQKKGVPPNAAVRRKLSGMFDKSKLRIESYLVNVSSIWTLKLGLDSKPFPENMYRVSDLN
ncbi:uncharacterized protein LOC107030640 isoform X2 [Solanum pennellii]|nr:uncharacterized protein LOC107030640 isoform X2 [Solanum pennellii]XP_027775379.1 uncharacterized protein LOC107030640 isoform X2 [Solanum pennellii]